MPKKVSTRELSVGLVFVSSVGFILSYYAYMVERAKEEDESYEAMCDISETISCTKAFMNEYGKGFGIIPKTSLFYLPNPLYGLVFYTLVAISSMYNRCTIPVVILGILSNIGTVYLARILYMTNNICVVCVSTYVVNAIILVLAVKKYRRLSRPVASQKKRK